MVVGSSDYAIMRSAWGAVWVLEEGAWKQVTGYREQEIVNEE